jgi:hypothetical protein
MYYELLMKEISELIENNTLDLLKSQTLLINPYSLIYMCDHYYKTEHQLPEQSLINKNDLSINKDLSKIKDYDIIHCGIDYLSDFLNEILEKIDKKIILTTGQVENPKQTELTDTVLRHKNVSLWVSQNPIYDNSDNFLAFPFGLNSLSVSAYATFLHYCKIIEKPNNLVHLPLNYNTNPCRLKLPVLPRISSTQFWIEIAHAKFILSPIGDKNDCYRHYEAIGLGTIPVSNVNELYKNIFTTNMVYNNIDEMANMLNDNNLDLVYKEPNKDLICYEYWKDIVHKKIADIKYANSIQQGTYYTLLIKEISELIENNTLNLLKSQMLLINPYSLIYMCDHYYQTEHPVINKNDLLINKDLSKIKDYDIVHCEIIFLNEFYYEILEKIDKKIILTTGRWHCPQVFKSELSEKILQHKNVLLWVSQNPIYDNSDKYLAFPYGLYADNIDEYARTIYYNKNLEKTKNLIHLWLNTTGDPCRLKLPAVMPYLQPKKFWTEIAHAKFILSPIGDRNDCYRHYEAIGLGTIPVSNVNELYKNIFTNNMVYNNIDEMANMLNDNNLDLVYTEPNKDLICYEYWKDIVHKKIADIKYANSISSEFNAISI